MRKGGVKWGEDKETEKERKEGGYKEEIEG